MPFLLFFQGGFARVHELIDLGTKSVVAGKIIHKSRVSKPHHKEKISREIELHRSLRHKNVVQFMKHFEAGLEKTRVFFLKNQPSGFFVVFFFFFIFAQKKEFRVFLVSRII
jgi:serine/threonine protein kinase